MAETTQGASAPKLTTARHAFERANAAGALLFDVIPGVPLVDALEMAGSYLAAAVRITEQTAGNADDGAGSDSMYGAHYLCELAHAVLQSAIRAAYATERTNQGEAS